MVNILGLAKLIILAKVIVCVQIIIVLIPPAYGYHYNELMVANRPTSLGSIIEIPSKYSPVGGIKDH